MTLRGLSSRVNVATSPLTEKVIENDVMFYVSLIPGTLPTISTKRAVTLLQADSWRILHALRQTVRRLDVYRKVTQLRPVDPSYELLFSSEPAPMPVSVDLNTSSHLVVTLNEMKQDVLRTRAIRFTADLLDIPSVVYASNVREPVTFTSSRELCFVKPAFGLFLENGKGRFLRAEDRCVINRSLMYLEDEEGNSRSFVNYMDKAPAVGYLKICLDTIDAYSNLADLEIQLTCIVEIRAA